MSNILLPALRLLFLIALGNTGIQQAEADETQAWEKQQKRFKSESIALFQSILETREKEATEKPVPCGFRAEWLKYGVPQNIGEKYFGLTVLADLSPSFDPGEPPEILDPTGSMREAFCTEKEDEEKLRPSLDKLKRGELKDEKRPSRTQGFRNYRLEYSVPLFDRHYRKAVVIAGGRTSLWWLKADGKVYNDFDEGIWASIYVKQNGRWKFLRDEPIAAASGGAAPQ